MLLDTSAWTEFFLESELGKKVKHRLETTSCSTSIVSIAEITNWAARQNKKAEDLVSYVVKLSHVVELSTDVAFLAGELNFQRKKIEKNWGMLDSFILATAIIHNLKVLTKDGQFRDLSNAEMLQA